MKVSRARGESEEIIEVDEKTLKRWLAAFKAFDKAQSEIRDAHHLERIK